ncbi:FtsW/RodA/SpoVE family cell cycle protein [Dermabacteraceae bacterium P7074]
MATVITHTAKPQRRVQALLLLLAVAIGVSTHALAALNHDDKLPADLWLYALTFGGVAVVLQLVMSLRAPYADPLILPIVLTINGIGVGLISSVDISLGTTAHANRQLMWTVFGVALCCATILLVRDHRWLRRYTWTFALAGILLLLLPLLPFIGQNINGSRIWIRLGSMSFQPGEIAKICLAIFCAGYLVSRRDTLALTGPKILGINFPRWRDFGPIVVAWLLTLGVLVFETDLGTSILLFGLFVAMLYVATDRLSWLIMGAVMFLPPAIYAATQLSHVQRRIKCWVDPLGKDSYSSCEQIAKGLFGLANGGLTGAGLGGGRPAMVPHSQSDFIFATLAEQLGLVGVFAILLLYLVLVQRFLRTGIVIPDGFGKLLAGGLGFVIALQVFVVVGGITRVIPLTGLTLPFMAAGGSSLVANWLIVGLLVRMSDNARRPAAVMREQVA